MSDEVVVERRGAVQVITINRPQARNALDAAVARGVADAVDELDASDELRAGVLTGAGGFFSAGMDLKAFLRGETPAIEGRGLCGITDHPAAQAADRRRRGLGAGRRLRAGPRLRPRRRRADGAVRRPRGDPVAGRRRGSRPPPAAAGAAGRRAGAAADRRADRRRAGGRRRPGQPRRRRGRARWRPRWSWPAVIAANGPLAVAATKRIVQSAPSWAPEEAWARRTRSSGPVFASEDAVEGSTAFAERRAPVWRGR